MNHNFERLHKDVQRWIWKQKWTSLRDIQAYAIEPILNADCDVIISASTASGKTEAAFLPACSQLAQYPRNGIGILYISPLKALINDQYRRLQSLGEILALPVTPWHGDAPQSLKNAQRKNPGGIILITPESFESLLLNQAAWCSQAFGSLRYIIIDEFHAFLGSERGRQMQSLMHRLEFLLQRTVPRIALSATLSDMAQVAFYLRPNGKLPCKIIESKTTRSEVKIQLRGYLVSVQNQDEDEDVKPTTFEAITHDLYTLLRGKSHLIFANSRKSVETLSTALTDHCQNNHMPNEFFPHHGNLSKDIRESLEMRLQADKQPTTAVCTMTLELGIDIGHIDSVAQVETPFSVASLRQRLGRAGRRGAAPILRVFIPEHELIAESHCVDRLRLGTIQSIAIINLLLTGRYESELAEDYHLSTLVQQTLSVIGQYGGVRATQLWSLLCDGGPFSCVDRTVYARFLTALGEQGLITQTDDGQMIIGHQGERLLGHFSFYCAFNTPEEYRLECKGQILGSIPTDKSLLIGQMIIFASKRWQILNIQAEKKLIMLKPAEAGTPPTFFGSGHKVHDLIREEMLCVYQQKTIPGYLDAMAQSIFKEGIENFYALNLDQKKLLQVESNVHIFPWLGDRVTDTITLLLRRAGLNTNNFGGIIEVKNSSVDSVYQAIETILQEDKPTEDHLANDVPDTLIGKYDLMLPKEIRDLDYGSKCFDVEGAWRWLSKSKPDSCPD